MKSTQIKSEDVSTAVRMAELAGLILLESGAETSRVEETVDRILDSSGYPESDVLSLPTGLFLTVRKDGEAIFSSVRRVSTRSVNLQKVCAVNNLSRLYVEGSIDVEEALHNLELLDSAEPDQKLLPVSLVTAFSVFFFAMLFRGGLAECLISALCGFITGALVFKLKKISIYGFAVSFAGGAVSAALTLLSSAIIPSIRTDLVISSVIMPLLSGLALTNAIRDTIFGDLVSGTARLAEALVTAVAVAFGAGVVLIVFSLLGGSV